jgi:chromosome segregation ATPase
LLLYPRLDPRRPTRFLNWYDPWAMPTPPNERRALEEERAELPDQILAHQNELVATPPDNRARRERLDGQIRNLRKRLVEVEARLAAIRAER